MREHCLLPPAIALRALEHPRRRAAATLGSGLYLLQRFLHRVGLVCRERLQRLVDGLAAARCRLLLRVRAMAIALQLCWSGGTWRGWRRRRQLARERGHVQGRRRWHGRGRGRGRSAAVAISVALLLWLVHWHRLRGWPEAAEDHAGGARRAASPPVKGEAAAGSRAQCAQARRRRLPRHSPAGH